MSVYIVVDSDRAVRYFDDKTFYDFVNETDVEDEEDKEGYTFLKYFPLPDGDDGDNGLGRDANGRYFGDYCPFGAQWPTNALFVLKDGQTFVPETKEVEKTIKARIYCEPTPKPAPRTRTRTPAQKQARRRR